MASAQRNLMVQRQMQPHELTPLQTPRKKDHGDVEIEPRTRSRQKHHSKKTKFQSYVEDDNEDLDPSAPIGDQNTLTDLTQQDMTDSSDDSLSDESEQSQTSSKISQDDLGPSKDKRFWKSRKKALGATVSKILGISKRGASTDEGNAFYCQDSNGAWAKKVRQHDIFQCQCIAARYCIIKLITPAVKRKHRKSRPLGGRRIHHRFF